MTKKPIVPSLEDELPQTKKEKKPSKIAQYFLPQPKPITDSSKIRLPKKPVKLRLLDRAPTSFNLGLTYIMLAGVVFVMILSNSILFWLIGIPTLYSFCRHIQLEKKKNKVVVDDS